MPDATTTSAFVALPSTDDLGAALQFLCSGRWGSPLTGGVDDTAVPRELSDVLSTELAAATTDYGAAYAGK